MKAIQEWHGALDRVIEKHASRLNGYQVVRCVRQATDAVWELGVDHAYHQMQNEEGVTEENAELFHLTWLAVFALKLAEHPGKRAVERR